MTFNAADILGVTKSVTKKWTQQRRAEDKGRSRSSRMYVYSDRENFTDVAAAILPGAYDHASGGGAYSVSKRQLFYACRETFKERTDRELKYNYFSGTLLVQYLNRHPETESWKVTADARGTLTIPNAAHEVQIPCGTLQIEEHLEKAAKEVETFDFADIRPHVEWPSIQHGQRYQGVLFIEKQGFDVLLEEAKISKRFDVAILSCKGQSVVAARKFVDTVCAVGNGVPLFVVHDCDKSGFEISARLTTVSDWAEENDRVTYQFQNEINVTDLGLRLVDAVKYGLGAETCDFKGSFAYDAIATPEEQEFLKSGRRIELNAFTSPKFIEWIETKLREHGLGKRLIPGDDVLEAAYRRALAVAAINNTIDDICETANENAEAAKIPKTLRRQLQQSMKAKPEEAWDKALYRIAQTMAEKITPEEEEDDDDE